MVEMRIINHTILGSMEKKKKIQITVDGEKIEAFEDEPIAAALIASGKKVFHWTDKKSDPQGYFCAIGVCNACRMIVDGEPNVRTCVTSVKEGMIVQTQLGRGTLESGK